MPTHPDSKAPAPPPPVECERHVHAPEPGTGEAELERLRSDNASLTKKLHVAQRSIAELNELLECTSARSNALVLEAEISNLMLEEIFNASHDAIWVLDRDFAIVRVNKRMAELVGQEWQQLIGRRCCDVLALPLCGTPDCVLTRLVDKKASTPILADVDAEFKGRGKVSCVVSAALCRDPCAEVLGIVEAFTDITARKQAEAALQQANEALARLSRIDGLTGLSNRRHFDEVLQTEWLRTRREKQFLSLLMADVDFFKRYNDTYGHQAGDHCLSSVAQALRVHLKRPADLPARYGGEEFALILPNTQPDGARHLAELVRGEVERLGLAHSASTVADHVTISIGVASLVPQETGSPAELIKSADEALYRAKETGRNRVVLHVGGDSAG